MERYVIIVAGGMGNRMDSGLPKQFIPIADKPLLMHTMSAFNAAYPDIHIIVVLPCEHIRLWKELCTEFACSIRHSITAGGKTRFHSVVRGLKLAGNEGIIGIHDGVRPFVSRQTIHDAYSAAEKHGAAVPVIALNDSLRQVSRKTTQPVDRNAFRLVQTPQCFRSEVIREAYKQNYRAAFTDDASVVEAAGFSVAITEGNFENIKITRTVDLAFAEVLSKKRFVI